MRRFTTLLTAVGLVGLGYVLGAAGPFMSASLLAEADKTDKAAAATDGAAEKAGPSEDAIAKIKAADDAIKIALEALKQEELYVPATSVPNALVVTAGGVNAVKDLESGRGVDPETFAALYAGLATDEVAPHLERDTDNRLLYKGKLIRMYPVSRLKNLYSSRALLAGEKEGEKKEEGK